MSGLPQNNQCCACPCRARRQGWCCRPQQRRWLVVLEGGFDLLVAPDLEEAERWTGQLDRSERCMVHIDEESL